MDSQHLNQYSGLPWPVLFISPEGKITWQNEAATELCGYTSDVLARKTACTLLGEEVVKQLCELSSSEEGSLMTHNLMALNAKGGKSIPVYLRAHRTNGHVTVFLEDRSQQQELQNNVEALAAMQETVARERNRSQGILDGCVDAVVTIDHKGIIQYFNPSAEKLWGLKAEEVMGKNVKTLTPPEIYGEHDSYLERYLTTGEKRVLGQGREVELINAEGERIPVLLTLSEVKDDEHHLFTAFVKDISKLKEAEHKQTKQLEELSTAQENIERERARSQGILDGCVDAVVTIDHKGIIQYFNPSAEKLWGLKAEDVMGKNVKALTPPEIYGEHDSYLERYLTTGEKRVLGQGREVELINAEGERIPVLLTLSEVKDDENHLFTAFVKDISKLKEAEGNLIKQMEELSSAQENIEKERRRSQAILDGCVDAVVTIDHTGIIQYFNPSAEQLWGKSSEEVLGENVKTLTPPEIYGEHDSYLLRYLTTGEKRVLGKGREVELINAEGKRVPVLLTLSEVKDEERHMFTAFVKDITKLKEAERNLTMQMDELASKEEELRQSMEEMQATQEEMARKQMDLNGQMAAINSTSAYVEFSPDGHVVQANNLFLKALGYKEGALAGLHHRVFCDANYVKTAEYTRFWDEIAQGRAQSGEFRQVSNDGKDVWLLAHYTPVMDEANEVAKVIMLATDITQSKLDSADSRGQLEAVNRSYAVVEFNLDGTIRDANDNFLRIMDYGANELVGRHHNVFVDAQEAKANEQQGFWENLNRGQYMSGTYRRIAKDGTERYIMATYNAILDPDGRPYKVVKYAQDITNFTVALKGVSEFLGELRAGNMEATLDLKADGDIGKMIEDNLALQSTLKDLIMSIQGVVKLAGEQGDLSARLEVNRLDGAWKELAEQVNTLLEAMANPMLDIQNVVHKLAGGDLSHSFTAESQGDMKSTGEALNRALDSLSELVRKISRSASVVADSSESMLDKSESMRNSTGEVASAISEMAKGAQDQAFKMDESSKLVNNVSESAGIMAQKADVIYRVAEKGQSDCQNGMKIITNLVENMNGISESAGLTSESISILTKRAEEIGRTLNVITDIASQTNLLALNAAIEAARAGEAGRGFSVVAEEIRKLAEDSRKSAVDIEKIILDVQKDTQSATKAIENMGGSVKDGNKATREVEQIFQEIAGSSAETLSFSREIKEATSEQQSSIELVVKNFEQIVVVAEETAAGTQQVASSSQELSLSMEEIASAGSKLSAIATELQAGINQFTIK